MVLFPLTMNTLQYWVTDNIIKLHPEHDPTYLSSSSSLQRETGPPYHHGERCVSSDSTQLHLSFDDTDDPLEAHARQGASSSSS